LVKDRRWCGGPHSCHCWSATNPTRATRPWPVAHILDRVRRADSLLEREILSAEPGCIACLSSSDDLEPRNVHISWIYTLALEPTKRLHHGPTPLILFGSCSRCLRSADCTAYRPRHRLARGTQSRIVVAQPIKWSRHVIPGHFSEMSELLRRMGRPKATALRSAMGSAAPKMEILPESGRPVWGTTGTTPNVQCGRCRCHGGGGGAVPRARGTHKCGIRDRRD
jgi:hypothetical protein